MISENFDITSSGPPLTHEGVSALYLISCDGQGNINHSPDQDIYHETDAKILKKAIFTFLLIFYLHVSFPQPSTLNSYNPAWANQSENSSESMPCGGGDIGLNVWVENNDVYFYFQRSGTFDENNTFLKPGRVKITLDPNPFEGGSFRQELKLKDGYIEIEGKKGDLSALVKIWVDVYQPVIHVGTESSEKTTVTVAYENWRYQDRVLRKNESFGNSYKWAPPKGIKSFKDEIGFENGGIVFYHRNNDTTIFDVTVNQQGLDSVKPQLYNPLYQLTFGGKLEGENFVPTSTYQGKYLDTDFKGWQLESKTPSKKHEVAIYLHTENSGSADHWKKGLNRIISQARSNNKDSFAKTTRWWNEYWKRSYIFINPQQPDENDTAWQVGRNYQLFRYMLGCNAYGTYPTKFNGGLFTVDPRFTDSTRNFTPDFRNWGGGTFTAQNQRLVYFPMFKSGDFDMVPSQLDFYLRLLKNAEIRSQFYWDHKGACFTEQLENFGLPNCSEYGWKRPEDYDKGMQYNKWLEYQWDTSLEFCLMMLELGRYGGEDIEKYIPFIESCLTFFTEHYNYRATQRGESFLDEDGDMVLFPGSSCETYKMANNATSTVIALQTLIDRLLSLPTHCLTEEKREY